MASQKGNVTKEDLKTFKEKIVHQFHVISEDVISQVKLVAEGVGNVNEKLDRTRQELKTEIQETRHEACVWGQVLQSNISKIVMGVAIKGGSPP